MIDRKTASNLGFIAVCVVVAAELFNGTFCYKHGLHGYLVGLSWVAVGFSPGIVGLVSANPMRAVGAAVCFVPWLVLAFYTDFVMPYKGGGASMIYIAVLFYELPSSLAGVVLTGPLMRLLGFKVGGKTHRGRQ